ncbi:hypothetical protein HW555_002138 [Spodoptera exigua]|uniref:Uncharacterized protein n=1 Tax=Spodoptera exigua TaxID=7107 RepID=A0A835GRT6_SPOEX|nr:hypothetical protein HW555_002138 [Spodoptera exigua]
MATITQTVQEFLPKNQIEQILPPKTKGIQQKSKQEPQALGCPEDCPCKMNVQKPQKRPLQLLFNLIGIIVALVATYLIVTTDSNMYLIFWICYSVLRRLTKSKSRSRVKSD